MSHGRAVLLAVVMFGSLASGARGQQVLLHERTMSAFRLAYLLERPEVVRELKLERARAAYARIQALEAAGRHIHDLEGKYLEPVAIQANLHAIVPSIRAAIVKSLGENLTDRQLARLIQLERQAQGAEAFADPEVHAALKLTDAQKEKIAGLLADMYQQDRFLFGQLLLNTKRPSTRDILYGMGTLPQQAADRIVGVLTPEQQATWRTIVGTRFFQDARGGY